jgi:hypothetical protein
MLLYRDGCFHTVATQGGSPAANEIWSRGAIRPGPETGLSRVSVGDLLGRDDASREVRRDWWLAFVAEGVTLSDAFSPLGQS